MDHPVLSKRKVKGEYQIIFFLQRTIPLCNLIISPTCRANSPHAVAGISNDICIFGWRIVKMAHLAFPMSTKPFI